MQRTYADEYAELYRRHWWWRAREALLVDELRSLARERELGPILDIGCGDGLFFRQLSQFGEVDGVEQDPQLVSGANAWGNVHAVSFLDEFHTDRSFGLVVMADSLEHFADREAALHKAVELTRPGGRLLITVPAFSAAWTTHDDYNHHYERFTKRSFRRLAGKAGLHVDKAEYFFHWSLPVKVALHHAERLLKLAPGTPSVPPRPVNTLLRAWSRAEQRTIGRLGLLPGSSLLVVGTPV